MRRQHSKTGREGDGHRMSHAWAGGIWPSEHRCLNVAASMWLPWWRECAMQHAMCTWRHAVNGRTSDSCSYFDEASYVLRFEQHAVSGVSGHAYAVEFVVVTTGRA